MVWNFHTAFQTTKNLIYNKQGRHFKENKHTHACAHENGHIIQLNTKM